MSIIILNKEKVIELIKYIFEPLQVKNILFEKPFHIYSCIRTEGDTRSVISEENKITTYPIKIETSLGNLEINLHSEDLHNLKHAIGIAYSYSVPEIKIEEHINLEINKRIYC